MTTLKQYLVVCVLATSSLSTAAAQTVVPTGPPPGSIPQAGTTTGSGTDVTNPTPVRPETQDPSRVTSSRDLANFLIFDTTRGPARYQTTIVDENRIRAQLMEPKFNGWSIEIVISQNRDLLYFQFPCQPLPQDSRAQHVERLLEANATLGLARFEIYKESPLVWLTLPVENFDVSPIEMERRIRQLCDTANHSMKIWTYQN